MCVLMYAGKKFYFIVIKKPINIKFNYHILFKNTQKYIYLNKYILFILI